MRHCGAPPGDEMSGTIAKEDVPVSRSLIASQPGMIPGRDLDLIRLIPVRNEDQFGRDRPSMGLHCATHSRRCADRASLVESLQGRLSPTPASHSIMLPTTRATPDINPAMDSH